MTVRLRRLPTWPVMAGGAVTGFAGGFFVGCILGALAAWFAGAVLGWHRQLGFTLGVTGELLPLGDQVGLLALVRDLWWLVVPASGAVVGVLNGLIGLLAGGLVAGLFNHLGHGVQLEVDTVPTGARRAGVAGSSSETFPSSSTAARHLEGASGGGPPPPRNE